MTDRAHMITPCENCPYRKDAPRQHWHAREFENLLAKEADPLGTTFACHKQGDLDSKQRGQCAGWALDQKRRGVPSIQYRILLYSDPTAMAAYEALSDGGHELFESVEAMCLANGVPARPRRSRRTHETSVHSPRVRGRKRG